MRLKLDENLLLEERKYKGSITPYLRDGRRDWPSRAPSCGGAEVEIHDPTTMNQQGPDVGVQYRSVIFCHTLEQQAAATALKEQLQVSGRYKKPIVTEIAPALEFWRAEEYHQRYFEKHRGRLSS